MSQPRRLRITWMELDLLAGLALTTGQQESWGLAGPGPVAVTQVVAALDEAKLDALVLPAESFGVPAHGDDVFAPTIETRNDVALASLEPSAVMQGIVLNPERVTHANVGFVDSYEVVGEVAELSLGRLSGYPSLLRQRHGSSNQARLDSPAALDSPAVGTRA